MGRLDQLKKGFPVEACPKCHGDDKECAICLGSGKLEQRVDSDWKQPELKPGEKLVAYLDFDEWSYIGIENALGGTADVPFPFSHTGYATAEHMRALGFQVEY